MNGTLVIDQGVDLVFAKISITAVAGEFNISVNGLTLVTVTSSNDVVTVTTNPANISAASSNIFTTAFTNFSTANSYHSTAAKTSSLTGND